MYQFKLGENTTYDTWGLILKAYSIGMPEPKTNYVSIPYGNGSIDLTEALTGSVQYNDRKIEATFEIIGNRETIQNGFSTIKNIIHGEKFNISVPEDDGYYYIGRIILEGLENKITSGVFDVVMICEPYRYKNDVTIIVVNVDGTQEVILSNEQKKAVPTFITNAEVQIVFAGNSYSISAGTHVLPIVLEKGDNSLQLNGTANVTISYQEGAL